ncbi:MAG: rhodanese-like domain-containing protein [Cyanobacteria bacterium P01_D01_bin.36]
MTTGTTDKAVEAAADTAKTVLETAKSAEQQVLDKVDDAQDTIGEVTPVPTEFKSVTSPSNIKKRLDWGEPALTILDARDRTDFNHERIVGAIPMNMDMLTGNAQNNLEPSRDIYIYGSDKSEASTAASKLQEKGFEKVSIIEGGLAGWKAIGGAVEGQASSPRDRSKSVLNQTATP